jgi:rubredoxin
LVILNLTTDQLLRLRNFIGADKGNKFSFLGFSLDLETNEFDDDLQKNAATIELSNPTMHHQITELLAEYSQANKKPRNGKLVKFKDFPGGVAYENAFVKRAVDPIAHGFSRNPEKLVPVAELIGGKRLEFGQVSVEVTALNQIPLTYILWVDEDFPPSANILFDDTAPTYLNAEGLANLAELATWRLLVAQKILSSLYVCRVCGYIYDPELGDPHSGIPQGTPFEKLPENWVCPICRAAKSQFDKKN